MGVTIIAWIIILIPALVGAVAFGLALYSGWTTLRVEKALPPLGRFVDVDGGRIHYLDQGAGPTLLLIHGLNGQMRHFTHSLSERLKDKYRVILVDRPGSGYSTRPRPASARIRAQADTIGRFIDALGLDRPLVVGHSLGGAIALSLALDHPGKVNGLALLAPVTHPQPEVPAAFLGLAINSALLRKLIAWTLAIPFSIKYGPTVLGMVFSPQSAPADFATKGGGLLALRPRSFIAASSDLMAAPEDLEKMPARYGSLKVPVGILFGTHDRMLNIVRHGEAAAEKIPGVDFEWIKGEGHMLPITSPDRVAKFIGRMAQRVAAAGAKPQPVA
jgi:pimeloyl-ACP methyl ester carboxylesterase